MCPILDQAWHLNRPDFFSFSSSFALVRQRVPQAFLTRDTSFSIPLGKVRRQTWQEPAPVGPSRLKMRHIHRVGALLAVGGSTTLAVQGNRSSSGVAQDFQMTCRKLRTNVRVFEPFPWSVPMLQPKLWLQLVQGYQP